MKEMAGSRNSRAETSYSIRKKNRSKKQQEKEELPFSPENFNDEPSHVRHTKDGFPEAHWYFKAR